MRFDNSLRIYEEALKAIPMGTSTFSKNPNLFVIGAAPLYIASARGSKVIDADGNEFLDYSMGLATVVLGYADPEVNAAAKAGIDDGLIFTLSTPAEPMLAAEIANTVPCARMVRFSKNGSDVCEGAVRLARRHTGRLKVLALSGYHGFHDWFIASTPRNKGIPQVMSEWVINLPYNDIEALEKTVAAHGDDIAALIMEPIISHEPVEGYLERVREITRQHGIVLIFDEMKTGFRLDTGGAQKYFGVEPDLAVFAKAMSNGFPISALAGREDIMRYLEDEQCFLSASYATEKCSLNAALKTMEVLKRGQAIPHIWKIGGRLKHGIRRIIDARGLGSVLDIIGLAPMSHILMKESEGFTPNEIRSLLQQECVRRGVLFVGYHHPSASHSDADIDRTLEVYDEAFAVLAKALRDKSLRSMIAGKPISAFGVRR